MVSEKVEKFIAELPEFDVNLITLLMYKARQIYRLQVNSEVSMFTVTLHVIQDYGEDVIKKDVNERLWYEFINSYCSIPTHKFEITNKRDWTKRFFLMRLQVKEMEENYERSIKIRVENLIRHVNSHVERYSDVRDS